LEEKVAIASIFKPWIVKRPNGGCQVLFPLTELDNIIDKVVEEVLNEQRRRVHKGYKDSLEGHDPQE
jgi:hypothetical protein